jgi:subtilisin family serine protease
MLTLFGTCLLLAISLWTAGLSLPRARAQSKQIGINVLLQGPITDATLAELGKHGTVLDTLPQINAVTLNADAAELATIQALPYVKGANPDRERFLAQAGGVPVSDFAGGAGDWNLDAINVTDAGAGRTVAYDGAGVYVAIIDGGLVKNWRAYFPEARIATQFARAFGGGGGDNGAISEQPNGWERDTDGHGTRLAGIVLGFRYLGPESLPVTFNGVAPKATVIPVRVGTNNSRGELPSASVINRALLYVTDLKTSGAIGDAPLVVNMSFGGPEPDAVERAVIDYAIAHGVVIISVAHNHGEAGMTYPGAYPPVISAGASGWSREFPTDDPTGILWNLRDVAENDPSEHFIAPFSGRELPGQDLDVVAPGFAVPAPYSPDSGQIDYAPTFGTSAAAPHVAGVAALLLQKNPHLTQSQIEQILENTAMPIAPGCRGDVVVPATGPGNTPTWGDTDNVSFFTGTVCWGSNATGHGLLQADAALAATPAP